MSAAETWVDLVPIDKGKLANFITESAILEMFLFTSLNPKGISKKLAIITGY
jgi:hypothetical protein